MAVHARAKLLFDALKVARAGLLAELPLPFPSRLPDLDSFAKFEQCFSEQIAEDCRGHSHTRQRVVSAAEVTDDRRGLVDRPGDELSIFTMCSIPVAPVEHSYSIGSVDLGRKGTEMAYEAALIVQLQSVSRHVWVLGRSTTYLELRTRRHDGLSHNAARECG